MILVSLSIVLVMIVMIILILLYIKKRVSLANQLITLLQLNDKSETRKILLKNSFFLSKDVISKGLKWVDEK